MVGFSQDVEVVVDASYFVEVKSDGFLLSRRSSRCLLRRRSGRFFLSRDACYDRGAPLFF